MIGPRALVRRGSIHRGRRDARRWAPALAVAISLAWTGGAGAQSDAGALGDPAGESASEPLEEAAPETAIEPPDEATVEPVDRVDEREVVSASPRTLLGRAGALWLELGMTAGAAGEDDVALFGGEVGLRYRVAESIVADVSWGLTWASTHVTGEANVDGMPVPYDASVDRVEPGNPTLGGAFVHRSGGSLVEIGLSVGIPTAARQDVGSDALDAAERESSALAQRATMAMRGYRGAFRWAPERLSLAIPFRLVLPVASVFFELDGALAALVPVLGDPGAETDTLVDLGAGVGWNVAGPLAIGLHVAGVGAPTGSTLPPFTLSAEPWARLRFDPVQISARGVLLLTGRDGFGHSRGPSFGVLLGAGVEL